MNLLSLSPLTSVGSAAALAVGTTCTYEPPQTSVSVRSPYVCPWNKPSPTAAAAPRSEPVKQESGELAERIIEHINYLRDVFKEGLISPETAREAMVAWLECWVATGYTLPVPAACTGPDGQMQYVWDRDEHHLELNFTPSEPASFFYRNRKTGELWMEDFTAGVTDPAALEKLKLVV